MQETPIRFLREVSSGEGIGYPLWSLVDQTVNNLPAIWETWIRSLGWEDPLEEGMATHSVFLPEEAPWTEEPGGLQSRGHKESDPTEQLSTEQKERARNVVNWTVTRFLKTSILRYVSMLEMLKREKNRQNMHVQLISLEPVVCHDQPKLHFKNYKVGIIDYVCFYFRSHFLLQLLSC